MTMRAVVFATAAGVFAGGAMGVTLGQVDGFESGIVMSWQQGPPSPNQPFLVTEDMNTFIRNNSSGGGGSGSRMVMFNRIQWAGGYTAAGVETISFDARNSGGTNLFLRVGLRSANGSTAGSNGVMLLAPGAGWMPITLDITDLMHFSGAETVEQILNAAGELRIYSAQNPSFQGDALVGTLDVDNITAGTLVPPCPADFSGDGVVDASDLAVLLAAWGAAGADLDMSGSTDAGDLAILLAAWGACPVS